MIHAQDIESVEDREPKIPRGHMVSSIQVTGYRGFGRFEMSNLGRLNLLVGVNNSGKTSVLEALYLLISRGDPMSLWNILWRRGERIPVPPTQRREGVELDISHLFYGHEMHIGSTFILAAENQTPERAVTFSISELTAKQRSELIERREEAAIPSRLVLHITGDPKPPVDVVPLTRGGGIHSEELETVPRRLRRRTSEENPTQFITAESLGSDDLVSLWDKVALTENEDLVLRALRFLQPDIERIAAQATAARYYYGVEDSLSNRVDTSNLFRLAAWVMGCGGCWQWL